MTAPLSSLFRILTFLCIALAVAAQIVSCGSRDDDGSPDSTTVEERERDDGIGYYSGYSLNQHGDPDSVVYETLDTPSNATNATLPPDVFLNASVHVGEIKLEVQNLTAQVNLAAEVLSLLQFNAGVDLSIDRVALIIQDVNAKVFLEARLANVVRMIGGVLDSLDLNPILATLGQGISTIASDTIGGLGQGINKIAGDTKGGGSSSNNLGARKGAATPLSLDYELSHNILYSINDYSGNTHTNRILARDGNIVDRKLHNDGQVYRENVVGDCVKDMTFTGYYHSVSGPGTAIRELEYVYAPFPGLRIVTGIFVDFAGNVVHTQVLSERRPGGSTL